MFYELKIHSKNFSKQLNHEYYYQIHLVFGQRGKHYKEVYKIKDKPNTQPITKCWTFTYLLWFKTKDLCVSQKSHHQL